MVYNTIVLQWYNILYEFGYRCTVMGKNDVLVTVRLPKAVVQYIDQEIESGMYMNRSDWIQQVLREYIHGIRGGGKPE